MPIELRRTYLDTIRARYKNAPKKTKKNILDEFCVNCGYSRKYAIRVLNNRLDEGFRGGHFSNWGHRKGTPLLCQRICL